MSAFSYQFPLTERRQWLTVAQLAHVTGKKKRAIQLACQGGDLANCHRFEPAPTGGPPILMIDLVHAPEKYRLAYAANKSRPDADRDITQLTGAQRVQAAETAQLIEAIEAYVLQEKERDPSLHVRDLIKGYLNQRRITKPQLTTPKIATYYFLREKFLAGGRSLVAVADQRCIPGKGVAAEFDEEAYQFMFALFFTQNQIKGRICYRQLMAKAKDEGWAVPCYSTVMRVLKKRVSKSKWVELREGPEARHNKCDPYIEQDRTKLAGNECWVSDHYQFDVIGYDDFPGGDGKPIRMWLTTWMDERSRFICGFRIHRGPNSIEVLASSFDAILAEGKPKFMRMDNGKDYRCHRFAGGRGWRHVIQRIEIDETAVRPVLFQLGITPKFAEVENARSKIVETWHNKWPKENFSRLCPGFCGGTIAERPEELENIIKRGGLLPWSTLAQHFATVVQTYHMEGHEGLEGKCPAIVRQETLLHKDVADIATLTLLYQDRQLKTIDRNGIKIDGRLYGLDSDELAVMLGQQVWIRRDSMKPGTIYVYDLNDMPICAVKNNALTAANATHEDIAKAKKLMKKVRDLRSGLQDLTLLTDAPDVAVRVALARQAAETSTGPLPEADALPLKPINWDADRQGPLPFKQLTPRSDGRRRAEPERTESPKQAASPDTGIDVWGAYSAG